MTIQIVLQVLGGVGVISSIFFTGFQVRRNTIALRAGANHNISQSFNQLWLGLAGNGEVAELILRSGEKFDSLTPVEKARIQFAMMAYMRTYENAYLQHDLGMLKDQDWDAVVGDMRHFLGSPFAPVIWASIADRSGAKFRRFVDAVLADLAAGRKAVDLPSVA